MSNKISENKTMEYLSSEPLNELTMLEETKKIRLRLANPDSKYNPAVISREQKLPDFYELKIRVRKYDFL